MRRAPALLVAMIAVAAADDAHAYEHDPSTPFELSWGGAYLAAFEEGTLHHLGGVGASFSAYFVPHVFSFEVVSHVLFGVHDQSFPIDLVVKADVVLSRVVHPYLNLGPTVVPEIQDGTAKLWVGASVALGVDLWFSQHWGLMIEANGN